jgi:hypothetical protein
MTMGPVEYMVVAFPGNKFNGEIAPALKDLVKSGTIRILDLALVVKDAEGSTVGMEIEHGGSEVFDAFEALASDRGGFVNAEDLQKVGQALEPNSAAALLVWEDLWASRIADAIAGSGGVMVDIQRIPRDVVEAVVEWNEENKDAVEADDAAAPATA